MLYTILQEIKALFEANGYTAYRIEDFQEQFVSRLSSDKFPAVFIGRQQEEIDNEGSPINYLSCSAGIDLNVVLNTGIDNLEEDGATELRKIKDIVYSNRCTGSRLDWQIDNNFIAQLANTNDRSIIYGGININTTVLYRENEIEGVL